MQIQLDAEVKSHGQDLKTPWEAKGAAITEMQDLQHY